MQSTGIATLILLLLRETYRMQFGSALGLMVGTYILGGIQDL